MRPRRLARARARAPPERRRSSRPGCSSQGSDAGETSPQELESLTASLRGELDAKQAELHELSEASSQLLGQDLQAAKVIELSKKVGRAAWAGADARQAPLARMQLLSRPVGDDVPARALPCRRTAPLT
jgi:hypothetical protein